MYSFVYSTKIISTDSHGISNTVYGTNAIVRGKIMSQKRGCRYRIQGHFDPLGSTTQPFLVLDVM